MYTGTLLEFLNMGGGEIMLILAVVLLLFGGKKLPELARGLGKGIRDFKDASEGVKREIHRNINAMDVEKEFSTDSPSASAYSSTSTVTADTDNATSTVTADADQATSTADTDTFTADSKDEIKPNNNI
ncbi:Sec-independent protein translocase subunit TatA/TatB [Pedobacter immunditicola]|uniref:Sec-independent protein translocase subunit TatA/TatB n=1 Tax=Pedobacter immunditicola TaxID=3133440 RepID=UPI00309ABA8F